MPAPPDEGGGGKLLSWERAYSSSQVLAASAAAGGAGGGWSGGRRRAQRAPPAAFSLLLGPSMCPGAAPRRRDGGAAAAYIDGERERERERRAAAASFSQAQRGEKKNAEQHDSELWLRSASAAQLRGALQLPREVLGAAAQEIDDGASPAVGALSAGSSAARRFHRGIPHVLRELGSPLTRLRDELRARAHPNGLAAAGRAGCSSSSPYRASRALAERLEELRQKALRATAMAREESALIPGGLQMVTGASGARRAKRLLGADEAIPPPVPRNGLLRHGALADAPGSVAAVSLAARHEKHRRRRQWEFCDPADHAEEEEEAPAAAAGALAYPPASPPAPCFSSLLASPRPRRKAKSRAVAAAEEDGEAASAAALVGVGGGRSGSRRRTRRRSTEGASAASSSSDCCQLLASFSSIGSSPQHRPPRRSKKKRPIPCQEQEEERDDSEKRKKHGNGGGSSSHRHRRKKDSDKGGQKQPHRRRERRKQRRCSPTPVNEELEEQEEMEVDEEDDEEVEVEEATKNSDEAVVSGAEVEEEEEAAEAAEREEEAEQDQDDDVDEVVAEDAYSREPSVISDNDVPEAGRRALGSEITSPPREESPPRPASASPHAAARRVRRRRGRQEKKSTKRRSHGHKRAAPDTAASPAGATPTLGGKKRRHLSRENRKKQKHHHRGCRLPSGTAEASGGKEEEGADAEAAEEEEEEAAEEEEEEAEAYVMPGEAPTEEEEEEEEEELLPPSCSPLSPAPTEEEEEDDDGGLELEDAMKLLCVSPISDISPRSGCYSPLAADDDYGDAVDEEDEEAEPNQQEDEAAEQEDNEDDASKDDGVSPLSKRLSELRRQALERRRPPIRGSVANMVAAAKEKKNEAPPATIIPASPRRVTLQGSLATTGKSSLTSTTTILLPAAAAKSQQTSSAAEQNGCARLARLALLTNKRHSKRQLDSFPGGAESPLRKKSSAAASGQLLTEAAAAPVTPASVVSSSVIAVPPQKRRPLRETLAQGPSPARAKILPARSSLPTPARTTPAQEKAVVLRGSVNAYANATNANAPNANSSNGASAAATARPALGVYVPPHLKQRQQEQAQWQSEKAAWRKRIEEEDNAVGGSSAGAVGMNGFNSGRRPAPPTAGPNIRTLARQWEPKLEQLGTCCFNPLQKNEGVVLDEEFSTADCTSRLSVSGVGAKDALPSAGVGVKGLPLVAGGRYMYEVELLREGSVVVGWSSATSLPSGYDSLAFGYGSKGTLVHNFDDAFEDYGAPYGRCGDVVGAILEWPDARASAGPRLSFALNGRLLGAAFDFAALSDGGIGHLPLQPHIRQAAGPPFKVLLRGTSDSAPLRFPVSGCRPLGECTEAHFSPFSSAVAQAADARIAASLAQEHLQAFQLPDSHIMELLWPSEGADEKDLALHAEEEEEALTAQVAKLLGLGPGAAEALTVRITGPGKALVAFRLRAYAERCGKNLLSSMAAADDASEDPVGTDEEALAEPNFLARPLATASPTSQRLLALWRGDDFRQRRNSALPTVARRLIHGCLGLQLPLSHLAQERHAARALKDQRARASVV